MVTTCSYDTSSADAPIEGGEETTDEMCDNYLTYYPSLWSPEKPNLFTACTAFEKGLNPKFVPYDDDASFVTLDLGGELYIEGHDADPSKNLAPCCSAGGRENCEQLYLGSINEGSINEPFVVDSDSNESLVSSKDAIVPASSAAQRLVSLGCSLATVLFLTLWHI